VLAVVVFGTAPRCMRLESADRSHARCGRGVTGGRTGLLSGSLLIAQVALSIVLLAGAVMFVRTLNQLIGVRSDLTQTGCCRVSELRAFEGSERRRSTIERTPARGGDGSRRSIEGGRIGVDASRHWRRRTTHRRTREALETDARGRRVESVRRAAFNFVTRAGSQRTARTSRWDGILRLLTVHRTTRCDRE
jgi:hypothetical protein